jgi:putative pyruvate formate lyase activating enzyme
MQYDVVFNPDGSLDLPDLPGELIPAVESLGFAIPVLAMPAGGFSKFRKARQFWLPLTKSELATFTTEHLWLLHDQSVSQGPEIPFNSQEKEDQASYLDLKVELARRQLGACTLCQLRCGVNRWAGESGVCGSQKDAYYGGCFLNWSEEKHLVPGIMIYLNGCNWECVYCQYPQHLPPQAGLLLEPQALSRLIDGLCQQGGRNIHWVGGNPDQSLWPVLATLQACHSNLPVVWNSNGYASEETLKLLNGVIDTFLIDFRYWDDACASHYGAAPHASATIQRNLKIIAQGQVDLIVRHLQLPGHFECCTKPILHWIASQLPGARLNLMNGQYRPAHLAYRYPEINRRLSPQEHLLAAELAGGLGINQVE